MLAESPQVAPGGLRASGVSAAPAVAVPGRDGAQRRPPQPLAGAAGRPSGDDASRPRSARKKKHGLLRRTGIALPAAGLALLLVVVVWGAAWVMNPKGTGASSLFGAIDDLGSSSPVALLEQERATLIAMTAAAIAMAVASKPATTNPEQILAAQNASTSASTSGQTDGGTGITTTPPPSNPTAAQSTARAMLASFGFADSQWSCLYDLWERESTWNVYAENAASGAYGIPQSLPGSKMATVADDWRTNPATQIRWGLQYIRASYGTPCAAWAFKQSHRWY